MYMNQYIAGTIHNISFLDTTSFALLMNSHASIYCVVVEGSDEEAMQARPVYVAAVDLSCKIDYTTLCCDFYFL